MNEEEKVAAERACDRTDAVAAVHAAAPDVVFTRVDVEGGHLDYAMRAMRDERAPFLDWVDDLVEGVAGEME